MWVKKRCNKGALIFDGACGVVTFKCNINYDENGNKF